MIVEWIAISIVGAGVIITGVGQIRIWMKNGREADNREIKAAKEIARRDGVLDTQLKQIFIGQSEIKNDLGSLNKNVNDQKEHCASVTSGFSERIKDLEKE